MLKRILILTFAISVIGIILIRLSLHQNIVTEIKLLDSGWKFHAGDDTTWAQPAFDDHSWTDIYPTFDIHDSFPLLKESGIGWLRLKIPRDSLAKMGTVALSIAQSVASEIYLNGKLLCQLGELGINGKKVKTYDPLGLPKPFPFSMDSVQVIAARVSPRQGTLYTTAFRSSNPLLWIFLMPAEEGTVLFHEVSTKSLAYSYFLMGLSIMLFILHICFFILYPIQKANLHFAMYNLLSCASIIFQLFLSVYNHRVEAKFFHANLAFAVAIIAVLFLNYSLQIFLKRKVDLYFRMLLTLGPVAVILDAVYFEKGWIFGAVLFQELVYLNIARLGWLSVARKVQGAWIIMIGAISNFVFFSCFIYEAFTMDFPFMRTGVIITNALANLSFPISISLFLALDFAFTNKKLKTTIKENAELAEKNLAQQVEKQELLSSINQQLETQVKQRTVELSKSLEDLKATQAQLIQSEKMASLGTLTAGIAHEIQNPLNFVNNFSEVNRELADEIKEAIVKGKSKDALELAESLRENEDKISHHGKRADAIVKSMLLHSRGGSGEMELTDINTLADEYLRLAFHGFKAKNPSEKISVKTDFGTSLPKLSMVQQDVGRVLLNLLNNAFYAVAAKKDLNANGYNPEVLLSTRQIENRLDISVRDNGMGIASQNLDKIFQPFFTTKPTGSGMGLGLSLSYDIVKAHGGELKVQSIEGEGTEFVIQLPL